MNILQENRFDKHQNDWNGLMGKDVCFIKNLPPYSWKVIFFLFVSESNGGIWAAAEREGQGEKGERRLQMEHAHSGLEHHRGLQAEAEVLLHEPVWEVQSEGSQTMETDATDNQNYHHHCSGWRKNPFDSLVSTNVHRFFSCFIRFLQLVSFGLSNEMMATFKEDNLMTFRHIFLERYRDHRQGNYALYTQTDVYDHIYYIIDRVLQTPQTEPWLLSMNFDA